MNKENAKHQIKELIDKYNKVVEENRVSKYNEEMTKKDFILPLFRALGWDVENSLEVTAEETISKKRVDYGFRINGIPKFFLEAKALKEDLNNPKFIGQAIDYAWAKSCTWAVLSDFENVMIFNAEWKTDNLLHNLLRTISCQEFLERFDELWLLSRESFEQGLINKEAERLGKKAKLASIDQYLLDDFARLRNALSKNILKYNTDKKLTEDELDETVQKLLNRLVFIRKAEDAELEARVLEPALREWESSGGKALYVRLGEIFKKFNEIYDSELFEKALVDQVVITNDVLKEVITGLYKPADKLRRYDFSIIDADVLGNVYEQYLGHILKKTKKRAEVKESHARRKEEGIYYTPTYIVDYIVRNTVGELLKDKKVDVEKIRILDPACGSGSFLIKAFDVLNEHYSKHDKDYSQTQLDTTGQGTTFTKKVEILQKNIFGVDLDKQAVEIARLNLLLKIAEKGERLPLLKQNIQCGNSLIDEEKVAGDKAFKWEREFKQIMDDGGFDVVIGNPPYLSFYSGHRVKIEKDELKYFIENYDFISNKNKKGRFGTVMFFLEKSLDLVKNGGIVGFIIDLNIYSDAYYDIRKYIIEKSHIMRFVKNLSVFSGVGSGQVILILKKYEKLPKKLEIIVEDFSNKKKIIKLQNEINKNNDYSFEFQEDTTTMKKIKQKCVKLEDVAILKSGMNIGGVKKFFLASEKKNEKFRKAIFSGNIRRYRLGYPSKEQVKNPNTLFLTFDKKIEKYIFDNKLGTPGIGGDDGRYNKPKLFVRRPLTGDGRMACVYNDTNEFYCDVTVYVINQGDYNLAFICGLLNSKLLSYINQKLGIIRMKEGQQPQITINRLKNTPIPKINLSNNLEKSIHDKIVSMVEKLHSLNKRLNELDGKKTDQSARIEEEIKRTDAEIDELVYKLYGITEEEKKVIEGSLK